MESNNLSVVLHKQNDLRLENAKVPDPGMGQVQVRMGHVGICGSDLSLWMKGSLGDMKLTRPLVLGHEISGVVSKVGEGVTNLQVGDKVAMEPVMPCGQCDKCKLGQCNVCQVLDIVGLPPTDGGLRKYHTHNADLCNKLPDNVSLSEGALVEPLSVSVHAARRAGVTDGSKVLICGAGTIGLLELLVCKEFGAKQVCVIDVKANRLSVAKELGADITIEVKSQTPRELAAEIEKQMGGKPNISIECSGAPFCVQSAVYATDSCGCVTVVGLGPDDVTIPLTDAAFREIDIRGSFAYPQRFPLALEMLKSGKLNVKPVLTHVFKMEEFLEAFEVAARGEGLKVMIECSA